MKKEKLFNFDLDCKISIYVPSTVDVNKPIENEGFVREILGKLSDMFGGATASAAIGGWRCANGSVVVEDVTIVYSFCSSELLREKASEILAICEDIKTRMRQEAVTLEINGQCKFI